MGKLKKVGIVMAVIFTAIAAFGIWLGASLFHIWSFSTSLFAFGHNNFDHVWIYPEDASLFPGEELVLYGSNARNDSIRLKVYPVNQPDMAIIDQKVFAPFQSIDDSVAIRGTGWDAIARFRISADSQPGWYVIEASSETRIHRQSLFIQPKNANHEIAYLFPWNTWNAYNYWGGQSVYTQKRSQIVSFDRPIYPADPFMDRTLGNFPIWYQSAVFDREISATFDSLGFQMDYYTDLDLELRNDWLDQYKLLVIGNHNEYWTVNMMDRVKAFLKNGGSIMILSGNTAVYECHYLAEKDQFSVNKTDEHLWQVLRPEEKGLFGLTTNLRAMHTYAPYRILADSSFIFEGSGLNNDDLIGEFSSAYDNGVRNVGYGFIFRFLMNQSKTGAASGLEFDNVNDKTPQNWVTIAKGLNPDDRGLGNVYPDEKILWFENGGADMGYYQHPGGGFVFNAGSVTFPGAIAHDKDIQKLLDNMITRILTNIPVENDTLVR